MYKKARNQIKIEQWIWVCCALLLNPKKKKKNIIFAENVIQLNFKEKRPNQCYIQILLLNILVKWVFLKINKNGDATSCKQKWG